MATEYRVLSSVDVSKQHPEKIPNHLAVTSPLRLLKVPVKKGVLIKSLNIISQGQSRGMTIKLWSGNDDVFGSDPSKAIEEFSLLGKYYTDTASKVSTIKTDVVLNQGDNLFLTAEDTHFGGGVSRIVSEIKQVTTYGALVDSNTAVTDVEHIWPGFTPSN